MHTKILRSWGKVRHTCQEHGDSLECAVVVAIQVAGKAEVTLDGQELLVSSPDGSPVLTDQEIASVN